MSDLRLKIIYLLATVLERITPRPELPKPKVATSFRWSINGSQSYVEGTNMSGRINNEQSVNISVTPRTQGGNPAPIDGDVAFASSDETVAVILNAAGRGCTVKAVGLGACQITAVFDARLGEEVLEFTASGALEVVSAEAATAEIVFGDAFLTPPDGDTNPPPPPPPEDA